MNDMFNKMSPTMKIVLALLVAGALFVSLFFILLIGSFVGTRNSMITQENGLNATYKDSQITLDTVVQNVHTTLGIANLQTDKLDAILKDAVQGRYQGATSAKPGQGQLFSAISEAYPQIDLSSYNKVMDIVVAGNEKFASQQRRMADKVRSYKTWKDTGALRPLILGTVLHAPSDHLQAKKGNETLHGQAALDQMEVVIQSTETNKAFDTGTREPLDVTGGGTTATTPAAPATAAN